jgi:hypothetical protein
MPNGNQLYGRHPSIEDQNVVIVPKPGDGNKYYIFTISSDQNGVIPNIGHIGFYYSVVDMSLNDCHGDMVPGLKNIPLKNHSNTIIDYDANAQNGFKIDVGRITTSLSASGDKIWVAFFVLFHENGQLKRYLYSYLVSSSGINNQADGTSPVPNSYTLIDNSNYPDPSIMTDGIGSIKISRNRQYLCDDGGAGVNMYNFNDLTGTVTFNRNLFISNPNTENSGWGVEFSPNSQLLYFNTSSHILYQAKGNGYEKHDSILILFYQHDINSGNTIVIGKMVIPDTGSASDFPIPIAQSFMSGLQLGLDNKIYVASLGCSPVPGWVCLGVINDPDIQSTGCNFIPVAFYLASGTSHFGSLPQWVWKADNTLPTCGIWPKAYDVLDGVGLIFKNNTGDILFSSDYYINNSTFYNHSGVFPPSNQNYTTTFHYTANGITNWLHQYDWPVFAFSSGIVAMTTGAYNSNLYYVNCNDGTSANLPYIINYSQEGVIKELNNGNLITKLNGELCIHNALNNIIHQNIFLDGYIKYNEANDDLIEIRVTQSGFPTYKVYHFNGVNFQLTSSLSIPLFTYYLYDIAIDNSGKYYFLDGNGNLNYYDPVANAVSMASIQGLLNQNLEMMRNNTNYTSDVAFVFNNSNNYIYALNLSARTSKKIFTSNLNNQISYSYDGDNIYLAGSYYQQAQIGNQIIPQLNQNAVPCFITKLSFQGDFQRPQQAEEPSRDINQITITISPNPVSSELNVSITENVRISQSPFTITVTDQMATIVLQKKDYFSGGSIDVTALKTGVYYLTVADKNGKSKSVVLLKL